MGRAIILVMDSFGIGAMDDADKLSDFGANTLIVYASADSVFQIACQVESFGHGRLYDVCGLVRELVGI